MSSALLPAPDANRVLKNLRLIASDFQSRCRASGKPMSTYDCQHCFQPNKVRTPDADAVGKRGCVGGLTMCSECGELNYVVAYPDGKATAQPA